MKFKKVQQHGQAMILYGLLMPLLFLCAGVGLDLGWYYLNVSRLQNAADAAVVAGAHAFVDDLNAKNKAAKNLVNYSYDGSLVENSFYAALDITTNTSAGDKVAADYALKNLSDSAAWTKVENGNYTLNDSWGKYGSSEVTLTPALYKNSIDSNNEIFYYVVYLTEKVEHLFMPGWFDSMDAPVISVAMLSKTVGTAPAVAPVTLIFDANGGSFKNNTTTDSKSLTNPKDMADDGVSIPLSASSGAPIYLNNQKNFKGWSTVQNPSEGDIIDIYLDGKQLNKNELMALFGDKTTVTLYAVWEAVKPINNKTLWQQMQYLIAKNVYNYYWYTSTRKYNSEPYNNSFINPKAYYSTSGSGRNKVYTYYYWTEQIDLAEKENSNRLIAGSSRYYIDFFQTTDGRLGLSSSEQSIYGINNRIHSLFNVNLTFPVREGYNDDPLYCRIEAEPYKTEPTPIRQIVININVSNMADNQRPLFFYYDGPDATGNSSGVLKPEEAQPVILNLNADFKGVLFMPDIPVVINGNGHIFEGFIIAKEFRYLSTNGTQVAYSSTGKTDKNYSDNKIRVSTSNGSYGNVYSTWATGSDALDTYHKYATNATNGFNLSSKSKFRTFKAETGVKYMYVFYNYDNTPTLDPTPFYDEKGDLIPLYKLDANGNQVRITKWEDVKLYDENHALIPMTLSGDANKGTVRLDSNGNPKPLFDEAGNPVYFCEDYVRLTGTYEVFTLDRVADGTRDPKEFLLVKTDELNISNTDDWK